MTFDYVVADSKNIVISAKVPVQLFIESFVQKNSNRYFWSFVVCANFLLASVYSVLNETKVSRFN